jgi:hypothetical protein
MTLRPEKGSSFLPCSCSCSKRQGKLLAPRARTRRKTETERLIRQHQIDYLLTQDLDQMVLQIGEVLLEVKAAGRITNLIKLLPIRVFTPFHFLQRRELVASHYLQHPCATARLGGLGRTNSVSTGTALVEAGLHPATGRTGGLLGRHASAGPDSVRWGDADRGRNGVGREVARRSRHSGR